MNDYRSVQEALSSGADPALLCATCPWDRHCISPPEATRGDIDEKMAAAKADDEAAKARARASGEDGPHFPIASMITAMAMGGRDLMARVCPVFTLRLRSSDGRKIADAVRAQMQDWTES